MISLMTHNLAGSKSSNSEMAVLLVLKVRERDARSFRQGEYARSMFELGMRCSQSLAVPGAAGPALLS